MPHTDDALLGAAADLRATLEAIGDSLVTARLDRLLELEAHLGQALASWPPVGPASAPGREAIRRELGQAHAALLRCRRLGATLSDLARQSGQNRGRGGEYDRAGLAPSTAGPRTVEVTA